MITSTQIWKSKSLWLMKIGTVAFVMIVVSSFTFLISGAAAQGHNNHMEWHYHSAYVAAQKMREAETRRAEQKVKSEGAEKKAEVAAPAGVITEDFEEGHTSNCRIVMAKEDTKC